MSVVIEAPSLVVRRAALDVRINGGMNTFLQAMLAPEHRVLHTCVDAHLVCLSFLLPTHARTVAHSLESLGFLHVVEDRCVELALIEQTSGPAKLCDWLELRQHRDGYVHAWLGANEPGELSAPEGWDRRSARRASSDRINDQWGDCVRISVEDGQETWLDLRTGAMATRIAATQEVERRPDMPTPAPTPNEPLAAVVCAALLASNPFFRQIAATQMFFPTHDSNGFFWNQIDVDEELRTIGYRCTLGAHVPEAQRAALAELVSRVGVTNSGCMFLFDPEDGWISAWIMLTIEQPVCSANVIHYMLAEIRSFVADHHETLMRVAFGGMSPYEYSSEFLSPDQS